MWLQIRVIERSYTRALVGTSTIVTSIDPYITRVQTAAQVARSQLAEHVAPGQEAAFAAFRDGYISVLYTNKTSLYALMLQHAKTFATSKDMCKKSVKSTLKTIDNVDGKNQ
jgi:hypothetical protein